MAKQEKLITAIADDNVIEAAIHASLLEKDRKGATDAIKRDNQILGDFFAKLADKFRDDEKLPPINKRMDFMLKSYDPAMDRIEAQIKAKALAEGHAILNGDKIQFSLPRSWKQYRSNVKKWIGQGFAKQFHDADESKLMGIGKITDSLRQASKADLVQNNPWERAKDIARRALGDLDKFDKLNADAGEQHKALTMHRDVLAKAIENFADAVAKQLKARGMEPTPAPEPLPVETEKAEPEAAKSKRRRSTGRPRKTDKPTAEAA